jgi:hypothetical protein
LQVCFSQVPQFWCVLVFVFVLGPRSLLFDN